MKKIFDKTRGLIFTQQTNLISSTAVISAMIVLASFFGFIRYRVLAGYFTKNELDVFFAAFRIPDLVFEILITGALTTTFIPFFMKYENKKEEQSIYISSIMNLIVIVLAAFITLFFFALPLLKNIIAPGYSMAKFDQVVSVSRLLLIGQLPFLIFGNFLTGMSQAKKSFFLPAIAPVIYNISIIATTVVFTPHLHLYAPVAGVMIGAFLFLVLQLPIIGFAGFTYRPVIKISRVVFDFLRLIVPRVSSVIVAQIDATVDLTLTTLAPPGSYSIFYLAQRLQLLPVSVFGVALGQASLPYLSEMYHEHKMDELRALIIGSVLNIFFFMIPIASFFIFARTPLVRLFFGGEKFDWDATVQTAITFSYFSLVLPIHSIYYFITRCFYALFDSKTPFSIGFFAVLLNAILSIIAIVILHLPVWSLGLTFSISMSINVCVLFVVLYKRLGGLNVETLFVESAKIIVSTITASVFSYGFLKLGDNLLFDTSRTINLAALLVITGLCFVVMYLLMVWLLNIREVSILTKVLFKLKHYRRRIGDLYTGVQG